MPAEPTALVEDVALELGSLALTVFDRPVFSSLNLRLPIGQAAVIEGSNRAGKSALLRALRREAPDTLKLTGSVRFRGADVLRLPNTSYSHHFLQHVGFVDEYAGDRLIPTLRVRELFRATTPKISRQDQLTLLSALGFADPESLLPQRLGHLSRGTRLGIAVALTLSGRPSVLFIDNVFFLQDPLSTRQWLTHLRQLQRTQGLAVIALACTEADARALTPALTVRLGGPAGLNPPRVIPPSDAAARHHRAVAESVGKPLLRVEYVSSIRLRNVGWRSRPEAVVALDSLRLDLWRGELLALVGASPSGKTTLALILARILSPTLGRVALRTRGERQGSSRLVLCFEDALGSFDPRLTIGQQLNEILQLAPEQHQTSSAEAALSSLGLETGLSERYPHQLSAGEVQLVALARALLLEPAVLVLDNALSAIERPYRDALLRQLRTDFARRHASILWLTHGVSSVAQHADRLGVLYRGRLVELGPSQEVRSSMRHPYTRALLDSHQRLRRTLQLVGESETSSQAAGLGGCVYFRRCPRAEVGHCDTEEPVLNPTTTNQAHLVACWHPHE